MTILGVVAGGLQILGGLHSELLPENFLKKEEKKGKGKEKGKGGQERKEERKGKEKGKEKEGRKDYMPS